jgi:hypothetical protein
MTKKCRFSRRTVCSTDERYVIFMGTEQLLLSPHRSGPAPKQWCRTPMVEAAAPLPTLTISGRKAKCQKEIAPVRGDCTRSRSPHQDPAPRPKRSYFYLSSGARPTPTPTSNPPGHHTISCFNARTPAHGVRTPYRLGTRCRQPDADCGPTHAFPVA